MAKVEIIIIIIPKTRLAACGIGESCQRYRLEFLGAIFSGIETYVYKLNAWVWAWHVQIAIFRTMRILRKFSLTHAEGTFMFHVRARVNGSFVLQYIF